MNQATDTVIPIDGVNEILVSNKFWKEIWSTYDKAYNKIEQLFGFTYKEYKWCEDLLMKF